MQGGLGYTGGQYSATPFSSYASTAADPTKPLRSAGSSSSSPESDSLSPHPPKFAPAVTTALPKVKRVGGKSNVSLACGPCKRAHLACDIGRPCKRCSNMGKEEFCQDVPHKKRGRPKGPKEPPEPFSSRPSISASEEDEGRWRTSWAPPGETSTPQFVQSYPPPVPFRMFHPRTLPSAYSSVPLAVPLPVPPLFTMFTTTDLRILRCTSAAYPLTGFPPQDFLNTNLLEWVIPHDRPLLEMELGRLMTTPMGSGPLHTDRQTEEEIAQCAEKELVSPVEGMREPYPNQSVRLMRSDQQYSLFNVRIHLGGGLGGSLWHPETHGKVYFVVSLLLLSPPLQQAPPAAARLSLSRGGSESAPVAILSRRQSYFPPAASPFPHLQLDESRSGSGSSGSSYIPSGGSEVHPSAMSLGIRYGPNPSPGAVYYPNGGSATPGYSQPLVSPLFSPPGSQGNSQSFTLPQPPYPASTSPKPDPQTACPHAQVEHGPVSYAAHSPTAYATRGYPQPGHQFLPLAQQAHGPADPRLMQAYWPQGEPQERYEEEDRANGVEAPYKEEGTVMGSYMSGAQAQNYARGVGEVETTGQSSHWQDQRTV